MKKKLASLLLCTLLISTALLLADTAEKKNNDVIITEVIPTETTHSAERQTHPATDTTPIVTDSNDPYHVLDDDRDNQPPVFKTPDPLNESENNPLHLTWSIHIEDPEGDLIDWTIHCDNGQTTGQKDEENGTKSLELINLAYAKTYTIWVNATDPHGSNEFTRAWYIFQTKQSLPPMIGTPTPANGSTNQPIDFSWGIPINDPEGDLISWTVHCSNGQSSSGTDALNGTKTLSLSSLAYSKSYTVWVNATDPDGSGQYTRQWYIFSTKTNLPPTFGIPSPTNSSTNQPVDLTWSIPITDPEGDLFSWTIQCTNGQANSGTSTSNGTKSLSLSSLAYSTTYTIWVNATDETGSDIWNHSWYTFTTTQQNNSPIFGTPTPGNNSINNPLDLTWSIPINDPEGDTFNWTIECSNGQSNNGNLATNGTKTLSLSSLTEGRTYKIWVNATDPFGSMHYTRRWYSITTEGNLPPVFGTPSPANGSTGRPLSFTWSIPINDPEGNVFSWTLSCSNGQFNSGTGALNGTKTLSLSGLSYTRTYTVWVNVTDPTGSGLYTRRWFQFTTRDAGQSPPPSEPPSSEPTNSKPVADASAGAPYHGLVDIPVRFDGSRSYDPDGFLVEWLWAFDDGTSLKGRIVNHSYAQPGSYSVILTVTDDADETHSTITTCTIRQQNRPPSTPTINGPTRGTKNTSYTYTLSSNDPDNDALQYNIDWGDGTNYSSGFLTNASGYSLPYQWAAAGRYRLTVTVTDNQTESTSEILVYIDSVQTRGAGYLLDTDGDGLFDMFYSDETGQMSSIKRDGDRYLIDKDGDGTWDYVYDGLQGLTSYQPPRETPGFETFFCVIALLMVIVTWTTKRRTPK